MAGGRQLKVWAGQMGSVCIARAMQQAMREIPRQDALFDFGTVVRDPNAPSKKVEPFYFDSRRGWNALALDIGFAPDALKMTTVAYPAVEFLCLVGLQRYRPYIEDRRVFVYTAWPRPLGPRIASVAVCGATITPRASRYRFENAFRTDQKKHKSFLPATSLGAVQ